jgi:uncharacterized protein
MAIERFDGEVAVVTGASSGLGELFARGFHQRGALVVLIARRAERLQRLAEELNSIRPNSARWVAVDFELPIEQNQELQQLLTWMEQAAPSILVNNAGRGSFGYFEQLPLAQELAMVRLNIEAPLLLAHTALAGMKRQQRGVIISVSSIAGIQPTPFLSTYAATKAFNYSQGLSLAAEGAPRGVRVLTVCPGPVETEFNGVARVPGTASGGRRDDPSAVVASCFRALKRGDWIVAPGLRGYWLSWLVRLLPRVLVTRIVHRMLYRTYHASMPQQGS